MQALLKNGRAIFPGDKVTVCTNAVRMWGSRVRTDTSHPLIAVDGTVISLTFERDPDTDSIIWSGGAYVQIPIDGAEGMYDTIVQITVENCIA